MPEQQTPNQAPSGSEGLQAYLRPPAVYGVASLALMGLVSFFLVGAYAQGIVQIPESQAAAAAAPQAFEAVPLTADAAIVIDLTSGKTLYEYNADAQLPLASITKVPMALAVAEVLPMSERIQIPFDTEFTIGAQRLLQGEVWTVRDIMHYTLVASSNGGAEILAHAADAALRAKYAAAPEGGAALWRMNRLAQDLGLSQTYFLNVSGLDASATQSGAYGSARDVAKIFAYAASTSPDVFAATAREDLLLAEGGARATAFNTNEALGSIPGLIMGKTGYTDLAGGNLAVVFDVGLAHPVVAVVLGSTHEGRFDDMRRLVDATQRSIKGSQ